MEEEQGQGGVVGWRLPPEDTEIVQRGKKNKRRRKDDTSPSQDSMSTTANSGAARWGPLNVNPETPAATTGADRLTQASTTAATSVAAVGAARPLTAPVGAAEENGATLGPDTGSRGEPTGTGPTSPTAPLGAARLTLAVTSAAMSFAALETARPLAAPVDAVVMKGPVPGFSTAAVTATAPTTADRQTPVLTTTAAHSAVDCPILHHL